MKKLGGISKKIYKAVFDWLSTVTRYPMESIEFVIALAILVLAANTIIPSNSIIYGSELFKAIFGGLLAYPALPLVWWRIVLKIQDYVYIKVRQRRAKLFLVSIATTYLMTLSMIVQSMWPPHWILYFALAAISWISYLRIGK